VGSPLSSPQDSFIEDLIKIKGLNKLIIKRLTDKKYGN